MNYRSYADLVGLIAGSLHRIPRDIDAVVGVPRSGLMAATIVALALNVRVGDVEGFVAGRFLGAGRTRRRGDFARPASAVRRILLVEDSVDSGASLMEAVASIKGARPDVEVVKLAAYVTPANRSLVDIALEEVAHPRIFQWNLFHHVQMENSCLDIDGVLCVDPTDEENDDGPLYAAFIDTALPMHLPTKRVGTLVTNRLSRYRKETEAWLRAKGVEYGDLVMCEAETAEERRRQGLHGEFKASVYRKSKATLFVESDPGQAETIARLSGKPVLCVEDGVLYEPGMSTRALGQAARKVAPALGAGISEVAYKAKARLREALGDKAYLGLKRAIKGRT